MHSALGNESEINFKISKGQHCKGKLISCVDGLGKSSVAQLLVNAALLSNYILLWTKYKQQYHILKLRD